ncbi:hypothetical protein V8C44DRAFT_352013 [Trichoderma aethiopicum]
MSLTLHPRRCNGEPSAQQSLTSALLQLPTELVIAIASHVPRPNQILASQTCTALRNILCDSVLPEDDRLPAHLPREEQAEFLRLLSRGSPGEWVCEECMELHPAYMHDTPIKPMAEGFLPCFFPGLGQEDTHIHAHYGFKLDHRHVQLALKHARLAATTGLSTEYLQRLLQPIRKHIRSRYTRKGFVDGDFSAYPKVVDGRFLVKSTFEFREAYSKICREYLGTIALCGHQIIQASDVHNWRGRVVDPHNEVQPLYALLVATRAAFLVPGTEFCGSCRFCGTDFAITATPDRVTLRCWQDFGPEGTTYDPHWRSHVSRVFSTATAHRIEENIRVLYGEEKGKVVKRESKGPVGGYTWEEESEAEESEDEESEDEQSDDEASVDDGRFELE